MMVNGDPTAAASNNNTYMIAPLITQPSNAGGLTMPARKSFSGDNSFDAAQWLRIFERCSKRMELSYSKIVGYALLFLEDTAEQWYTDEIDRGRLSPDAAWLNGRAHL